MIKWMKFISLGLRKGTGLTTGEQSLFRELDAQDEIVGNRIAPWYWHGLMILGVFAIFILGLIGTCKALNG
jgi:hypothetical protein